MAKKRTRARELALHTLYMHEITKEDSSIILHNVKQENNPESEVWDYTKRIVDSVVENYAKLDEIIQNQCVNWDLNRVAILDKNVLRIAITEILHFEDIPEKVSIDEAIEMAKSYSTDKSGTFVNGILDPIAFKKK